MYQSVAAAFERAVGVGFDVRRAYRLKDGGGGAGQVVRGVTQRPGAGHCPAGVPVGATSTG